MSPRKVITGNDRYRQRPTAAERTGDNITNGTAVVTAHGATAFVRRLTQRTTCDGTAKRHRHRPVWATSFKCPEAMTCLKILIKYCWLDCKGQRSCLQVLTLLPPPHLNMPYRQRLNVHSNFIPATAAARSRLITATTPPKRNLILTPPSTRLFKILRRYCPLVTRHRCRVPVSLFQCAASRLAKFTTAGKRSDSTQRQLSTKFAQVRNGSFICQAIECAVASVASMDYCSQSTTGITSNGYNMLTDDF